jgi:hypothetical protein
VLYKVAVLLDSLDVFEAETHVSARPLPSCLFAGFSRPQNSDIRAQAVHHVPVSQFEPLTDSDHEYD